MSDNYDFTYKEIKPLQGYTIEKITKQVAIYQILANNFSIPPIWLIIHYSQLTPNNYNLFID